MFGAEMVSELLEADNSITLRTLNIGFEESLDHSQATPHVSSLRTDSSEVLQTIRTNKLEFLNQICPRFNGKSLKDKKRKNDHTAV